MAQPIIIVKEDTGLRRARKRSAGRKAGRRRMAGKMHLIVRGGNGAVALDVVLNVAFDSNKNPKCKKNRGATDLTWA